MVYASEASSDKLSSSLTSLGLDSNKQYLSTAVSTEHLGFSNYKQKEIEVRRHDTLYSIFSNLGLSTIESQSAIEAFGKLMNTKHIGPGDRMMAYIDQKDSNTTLVGLSFWPDKERQLLLSRTSAGEWMGYELKAKLINRIDSVQGSVSETLYSAITNQGTDQQVVHNYADIFGYDVDFQREIQKGDQFEIVYETFENEEGEFVKTGNILYASFKGQDFSKALYRYQSSNDIVPDYYDESGKSVKRFIMKTPINGARLSSNFGMRRHPILGYTRAHNGTDFAAPVGTPIYAGGDGTIVKSEQYGGYGNYILIRHNSEYSTAYGHLSRYASGIRPGVKVRQGQVIGYVGTTGRSTGPHLHYEVHRRGKPINVSTLKSPEVKKLAGDELNKFIKEKNRIESLRHQKQRSFPKISWAGLSECYSQPKLASKCNSSEIEYFLQKISY